MDFAFTQDQEELRKSARRFLAQSSSSARVRAAMKTDRGWDPEVWQRIAQELGWASLLVPEEYGGAGAGYVELVGILEETGYALLCAPFFSTVALGTNALLLSPNEAAKALYLPQIAAGEITATVAYLESSTGVESPGDVRASARKEGADYILRGAKRYVVDGHTASILIVSARLEGGDGDRVALFVVQGDAAGVDRTLLGTMDMTRKLADVTLNDVRVPASAMIAEPGVASRVLEKTLERACIALAAEQIGGAQRCLEMSVDYAKVRHQFGRPIGSFQAIKHKCADMLVDVEAARSAGYYAGCIAAQSKAGIGEDDELTLAASTAKAFCSEAFFRCAAETIQVHGGIGFTWEHDAHLYFKRAKITESLFGDPSAHREIVAAKIGLR